MPLSSRRRRISGKSLATWGTPDDDPDATRPAPLEGDHIELPQQVAHHPVGGNPMLAQPQLGDGSRAMIAAIEAGHKTGGIATLKKLAAALNVDLENLA